MKKVLVALVLMAFVFTAFGSAMAGTTGRHRGPAPNSGDCIPDGPGW